MIQTDPTQMNTSVHNGLTCSLGFRPLNLRSVGKEGIPKAPLPLRQPVFPQPPRQLSAAAEPSKESGSRPTPVELGQPSFGQEQGTIASRPNEPTRAVTPRGTISPAGRAVEQSQERVIDTEKTGEVNTALPEPTQEIGRAHV